MLAELEKKQQAMADIDFVRALLHDDRGSFYARGSITPGGWRQSFATGDRIVENLRDGRYARRADQYISCNGYVGANRSSGKVRQVNAVFIDLDRHDVDDPIERERLIQQDIQAIVESMSFGDMAKCTDLAPTYLVHTGRGLAAWYIFEHSIPCDGSESSHKALKLREAFVELASGFFEKLLGIAPDRACSDLARVGRIPGTWNSKAECYAKTLHRSGCKMNLAPAVRYLSELMPREKTCEDTGKRSIKDFNPLLHDRAAALVALQASRRGSGEERLRNEMLYAFAETAVREFAACDAMDAVEEFNNGYACPLGASEVDSVFKSAISRLKRNLKVYGSRRLAEHIGLSREESAGFFGATASREAQRAAARTLKAERNARIEEMLKSGESYSTIAGAVGCTKQTVYNFVRRLREARARRKRLWRDAIESKAAKTYKKAPTISSVCTESGEPSLGLAVSGGSLFDICPSIGPPG